MAEYQLGVIGAGNMAEALLRGVTGSGLLAGGDIVASDPVEQRRGKLSDELGIACTADNLVPAGCGRVVLAVKPQVMGAVLDEIAGVVREDATVVSIAAGIKAGFVDSALNGRGRIVRVMPNTPMLAGAGISALAAGPRATDDDMKWTETLLAASGSAVVVQEQMMDAVTAVSGSGPAYFCYLVEAMIAAGVAEGLSHDVAAELARQTCAGTGKLMVQSGDAPEVLRARVTSPGGTTQRAVETLDAAGVKESLTTAVRAAAQRSRELGK